MSIAPVRGRQLVKLLAAAVLASLCLVPLSAQSGSIEPRPVDDSLTVFAPFVSKIRMAVRDPEIKITWTDIPGYTDIYRIYRHTSEITPENFAQAEYAGFANQGEEQYIDLPRIAGTYFYAVVASDAQGGLYQIFIPLRNATITGISVVNLPSRELGLDAIAALAAQMGEDLEIAPTVDSSEPAGTTSTAVAEEPGIGEIVTRAITEAATELPAIATPESVTPVAAGTIPAIQAQARTDLQAITITLGPIPAGSRWAVYRSPAPIVDSASLESAALVAAVDSDGNELRDYVVPGIPWYYAAVNADTLSTTSSGLVRGTNTLVNPVALPLGSVTVLRSPLSSTGARDPGLPLLNPGLSDFRPTFQTALPVSRPASSAAQEALESIKFGLQSTRALSAARSDVLDGDLNPDPVSAPAEALILATVLKNEFAAGNWAQSIILLENVLTLPLEAARRERAEYYLAQARYFNGDLQQAFMTFLLLQNNMASLAAPWLDRILRDLGQG